MQENKIKITWYGTASVRISTKNSQFLIDPFFPLSGSSVSVEKGSFDNCGNILITHGHYDHIGSISDIVRKDTTVYCTKAPYHSLCRKGVNSSNLRLIKTGSVIKIGDFRITTYKGRHIRGGLLWIMGIVFGRCLRANRRILADMIKKFASCREKGETLCYLAEACGKRILILGSLSLAKGVSYPSEVDLAVFPYQGSPKLEETARNIYRKLRPKAVMLTHFDNTFPPFSTDIDTSEIESFLKKHTKVYKLEHGESFYL